MGFDAWAKEAAVLVVDDEPSIGDVLKRILRSAGFHGVNAVDCPIEAAATFRAAPPDLVVLDYRMPRMSGLALLEDFRGFTGPGSYLPVVMLTGDMDPETKKRALVFGVEDFLTKPVDPHELVCRIRTLLRTRYLHLQIEREKVELEARVAERVLDAERAQAEILERLAIASDYRDDETGDHTRRVGDLAGRLANRLGLDPEQAALIRQAAQLHDVGKIGVSDDVLLAPGKLTSEQFAEMKQHTLIGREILAGGRSELLLLAEGIACSHHERWDGNGYPHGLKGDEIPLAARIVAVVDFFDALTHDRRYRAAVPVVEVVQMIREGLGTHFDPDVVTAFLVEMGGEGAVPQDGSNLRQSRSPAQGSPGAVPSAT